MNDNPGANARGCGFEGCVGFWRFRVSERTHPEKKVLLLGLQGSCC